MQLLERPRSLLLSAALVLCAGAASAMQSSSADFTNTRSAVNSGGLRKTSPSFRSDAAIGALAQTAENSADYHARDGLITGYYYPASVTVAVSTVYTNGTASLQFVSPGNDGNENSIPGGYLVHYSSIAAQSPELSDALFAAAPSVTPAPPAAVVQGTTVAMTIAGLKPGVTYYFAVKTYERDGLRSVLSKTIQYLNLPQTPYGIGCNVGVSSVTLRWMPVVRFTDGIGFVNPLAAAPSELNGYHVFRATAPTLAPWTDVADLSTTTWSWTDTTGDPVCQFACYYYVAASNLVGYSAPSTIRSAADRSAYMLGPDGVSWIRVDAANVAPIEGVVGVPNSAYLVTTTYRPQDLGSLNGTVMKSVEWDAYQGGVLLAPNLPMPGPANLSMNYQTAPGTGLVTPSGFRSSAVSATPENMSIYWYNGSSWVQMYGKLDTVNQAMTLQTTFVGQYQLRTVERAGGFNFSVAGISNRFLTPNGDGKNDNVVFQFDNPNSSPVTMKIYDMKGRLVTSSLPAGPSGNSLVWDGTSNGAPVAGGVYVYQMQCEGKTYSGTLVVIR